MTLPFTPVVIIGAGRSGTNMLRDMMTNLEEFATWDCDEINPIWRHGNISWPNDEIPPDRASKRSKSYIRNAFSRIWKAKNRPAFIVEKTCANSLRVPFIDAVLPEAKYIYIVRDGVDVVASARKRWKGEFELPGLSYFISKARYAPILDLPFYGFSFVKNRIALLLGNQQRLSVWGPRFIGMDEMSDTSLDILCAHQWVECVTSSDEAFAALEPDKCLHLRYEDIVSAPHKTLEDIVSFLDLPIDTLAIKNAVKSVSNKSVGKGYRDLGPDVEKIMSLLKPVLKHHRY